MLLTGKNVVLYGVGDSLGGAVARAFAEAGATVFATARRLENAKRVVDAIVAAGGKAHAAKVDALDARAVDEHANEVFTKTGSLDVSFNLINIQDKQDVPLVDMTAEDFVRPVQTAMLTQFLTCTAAARLMTKQKSGVVLSLTATPGGIGYGLVGGFGPACCAIESFSRDLAAEVGPFGVRVVNLRSAGSPDSRPFEEALRVGGEEAKAFIGRLASDTMLKRLPLMKDIANAAVFLASPLAGAITGVTLDITSGTTTGLNHDMRAIAFAAS